MKKLIVLLIFIMLGSANIYCGNFITKYFYKSEQKKIEETPETSIELKPTVESFINNAKLIHRLNKVVNIKDNTKISATQTKKHIGSNVQSVSQLFLDNSELNLPKIKEFILKIYRKEKEERQKGNYVFYHGRKKEIKFLSDIYKQLWNITKNDDIGNDFTFLRFNQQEEICSIRQDCLFMNHSLFGNSNSQLSCTISYYWLKNNNFMEPYDSVEDLFNQFNLEKYYNKYKLELQQLENLHRLTSSYGEILLISISSDKIEDFVLPVGIGGSRINIFIDTKNISSNKEIINELIKNPDNVRTNLYDNSKKYSSDSIEWVLKLTKEYALNPHKGPKIYSFYLADENIMSKYIRLFNYIFGNIRKDVEEIRKNSASIVKSNL